MTEATKQPENRRDQGRTLRACVAGLNVWFCSAGYPWWFLDAPAPSVTAWHLAPLVVLGLAATTMSWTRTPGFLRENAGTALLGAFPLSIAGAVIARERVTGTFALSGPSLLWCVLSLWVFVGVLTEDTPPETRQPPSPLRRSRDPRTWRTAPMIAGALLTTTLGPTFSLPVHRSQHWSDADVSGALLTSAIATAFGLGSLLLVLGPSAIKPRRPTSVPWPRRMWPHLLVAALGCGTYLLIGR